MKTNLTTYPETAPLVAGLRHLLQAEDKVLDAFLTLYGAEVNEGDARYRETPIPALFDSLKREIKIWIGETFELGMSGLLESPGDPELLKEEV